MEQWSFPNMFSAALKRRAELLSQFDAVRLVDGIGDQLPELYVDRLGSCAVAHFHGQSRAADFRQALSALPVWSDLGVEAVFFRQRFRESARSAEQPAEVIWGNWRGTCHISEHGARYLIDPERHINAGFFIDMRELRLQLQKASAGKRVLNLFCYSGSLGISALTGGAAEVVQVDISKGILAWARENLALNTSVEGSMRVIPEDSLVFMQREARRIENGAARYDVIVIDPPSFSRSSQGTFQIQRDFDTLVEQALPLLATDGRLALTTNFSAFKAEEIAERILKVIRKCRGRVGEWSLIVPPSDFPSLGENSIAARGAIVSVD